MDIKVKPSKVYFAADEAKVLAANVENKANSWFHAFSNSGHLDKLRRSYYAYYGTDNQTMSGSHQINYSGEQGELVQMVVNHYRNIATNIINMIMAIRPSMQARAVNTDYKSLIQADLANDVLDYYMREKRIEAFLKKAVESAVVFGTGYIKMDWNVKAGELVEIDEESGMSLFEGDVEFKALTPFDVIVDGSKETDAEHDWYLVRSFKNRYDLAAKYPEQSDNILNAQTKDYMMGTSFAIQGFYSSETDDIAVKEFFHRPTESLPMGRYVLYVGNDTVLIDSPLPYKTLPLFKISPANIIGSPYGYTPMFDLLPLQDAINSLYSTIITNQSAFGVQNVVIPKGAQVNVDQISGGLNLIEMDMSKGIPTALNLTQTPAEIFSFLQQLVKDMEVLSGVNSVTRGNPESSLKTGPALALVQSMAVQFMSGLQQEYIQLIESMGTALIKLLQQYALSERVINIIGENNRSKAVLFKGEDIEAVSRVVVEMSNPISKTTAGRLEIAQQLISNRLLTDPEDYISILNTGNLKEATKKVFDENMLIDAENEAIMRGEIAPVSALDKHSKHILSHRALAGNPQLRQDPQLMKNLNDHILEHINQLETVHPAILSMIGEQSLMQPPQAPQGGPEAVPGMKGANADDVMNNPMNESALVSEGENINMPQEGMQTRLPNMPKNPIGLPTNPADNLPQ